MHCWSSFQGSEKQGIGIAGEPTLLGSSALFVPLIWYRVGRWVDNQSTQRRAQAKAKPAGSIIARALAWFVLVMIVLAFPSSHYHYGPYERFILIVSILWIGTYLVCGLWSDWRTKRMPQRVS